MEILFERTLENMCVYQNDDLTLQCDKAIEKETKDAVNGLLTMINEENQLAADEFITDIEYFNKVKGYEYGFRSAIRIMLDTFLGGKQNEIKE